MEDTGKIYLRKLRFDEAKRLFQQEIEKNFIRGIHYVEVIHGIGTYTLRNMVINEIASMDYVHIIESTNPGSLLLELQIPDPGILKKYT